MRKDRSHFLQTAFVIGTVLLTALVYIYSPRQAPDLDHLLPLAEAYDARILRDRYGVPHIFGSTDPDAAFGLAYAHSEDDFKTIQEVFLAARGDLAAVYGPDAAPVDFLVRLLRIWDVVEARYESDLAPETRALLDGYADGVNLYAAMHPEAVLSAALFPLSGRDLVAASVQRSPLFFGLDNTLNALFADTRPSEISSGPTGWRAPYPRVYESAGGDYGSNVFALGPVRTTDDSTFLAVNSHQPWEGPVAWYEAHVRSEAGWDIAGALFPGAPVIIHGHNRHLGWGFAVNSPDLTDVYVLAIDPENEYRYRLDGEWRDLEVRRLPIRVRLAGNLVISVEQEFLWSEHGPVVRRPHGTYAIRFAGFGRVDIFEQLYRMNRAQDFESWQSAMRDGALPMFNVGYADADGNIYYLYNGLIPRRPEGWDWSLFLPGDRSDLIWSETLPFEELPQVFNPQSGYIQNANSSPFQTTAGFNPDPAAYSPTLGIETDMSNRALRLRALLGGDELLSFEDFIAVKWDMRYDPASDVAAYVTQLSQGTFDRPELAEAQRILSSWDLQANPENPAASIGMLTLYYLNENHPPISASNLAQGLSVPDEVLAASFAQAADHLLTHFGRLDVPWGRVNRLVRGNQSLGVGGGPDLVHAVYGDFYISGRLRGVAGDGVVYLVAWRPDGTVESWSVHQYGSATLDEDSPYFGDQADLFVNRQLKPVWLDEADILSNLERAYRPGE